jgi:hypothetical protein
MSRLQPRGTKRRRARAPTRTRPRARLRPVTEAPGSAAAAAKEIGDVTGTGDTTVVELATGTAARGEMIATADLTGGHTTATGATTLGGVTGAETGGAIETGAATGASLPLLTPSSPLRPLNLCAYLN